MPQSGLGALMPGEHAGQLGHALGAHHLHDPGAGCLCCLSIILAFTE